jgi:hypothetical protein
MPSNKTAGENVGPQKGKKNEEKENARQRRFARCWLPALVAIGKEVLLQTPLGSRTSCGAVGRACMSGVRFVRSDGWGWCPEWDWRPVRNDPPDRTFPRPRSTACPSTWISDTRLGVLKSQESGTFAGLRLEVPDPSQTVSLGPGIAITHNPFFFFFSWDAQHPSRTVEHPLAHQTHAGRARDVTSSGGIVTTASLGINRAAGKRRNVTRLTPTAVACRPSSAGWEASLKGPKQPCCMTQMTEMHALTFMPSSFLLQARRPWHVSSFLHPLVTLPFHKQLFEGAPVGQNQSVLSFALPKADQTGCVAGLAAVSDCAALV